MKRLFPYTYIIIIGLWLVPLSKSHAEYRAFELLIQDTEKNKTRTVLTVLDHIQYPQYYPLNKGETISYVDSWMCFENMSFFRKICPKPDRTASSTTTNN